MRRELPKRKAKIVATLGPASCSRKVVRQLIEAGMNVARLNFSHGTHEEHKQLLTFVREEAEKLSTHVAVFQDLCGPKVRISRVDNDEVTLVEGAKVNLCHTSGAVGTAEQLFVEAFDPSNVMSAGDKALLSDGRIELVARSITNDVVQCEVVSGGIVRSRSGIAVPDSQLSIACITEKDLKDLAWAVEHKLDYVALSFVSSAKDIVELREKMRNLGEEIPIIAKIERARALDNITDIVGAADAVMVARGDLGLELALETVPRAQRLIIEQANHSGTPVITATQMLQSMVNEVRPTRAEVSDVFTAVLDGTDAVMLSEETAIGNHPVRSIEVLDKIVAEAEREFEFEEYKPRLKGSDRDTVADAIAYAACGAANKILAAGILACTNSGYTALLVAKYRPQQQLYGASPKRETLRRMALYWGVQPVDFPVTSESTTEEEVNLAMEAARDLFGLKQGSRVVITAGLQAQRSGTTTLMEIREIPRTS